MILDFSTLPAGQRYIQTIQTLVPRPIAWVLTGNSGGDFNLAPFSFFTAVCSEPPILMLSLGKKPDGSLKDTRLNMEERCECVIHIPGRAELEAMNASSASLAHGESEVTAQGLELTAFEGFGLPRLADAKVAFGCRLYEVQEIGAGPQSLLFVEVQCLFIDDAILEERTDGRIKVDTARLDPIARLGANEYAFLHDITQLKRPE